MGAGDGGVAVLAAGEFGELCVFDECRGQEFGGRVGGAGVGDLFESDDCLRGGVGWVATWR